MKKVFALILTAVMLSSLTACSENQTPADDYINVNNSENVKPNEFTKPDEASKPDDTSGSDSTPGSDNNSSPDNTPNSDVTPEPSEPVEPSEPDEPAKPTEPSKPAAPSDNKVTLPLAAYPDGSYFTKDGKECGDHSDCTWINDDCNCINFDLAIQSIGFAKYVYYTVTGDHLGTKTVVDEDITAETAKAKLMSLPAGSYIGVNTKDGWNHAMAVISTTEDGITFYQANYNGNCLVSAPTYTWAEFAKWFPHLNCYVKA